MYKSMYSANYIAPELMLVLVVIAVVEIILKGIALWRSAQKGDKYWFVAILILNTVGILPAVYLLTHPEKQSKKKK